MITSDEYFNWLIDMVDGPYFNAENYTLLLNKLFDIDFYWLSTFPSDEDRAKDGANLRIQFMYDMNSKLCDNLVGTDGYLDDSDCSFLELMIALATKIEDLYLYDKTYGDRTSLWFSNMLGNCSLLDYDDSHFDDENVENVVHGIMSHQYDVYASLFGLDDRDNVQNMDIWNQMVLWVVKKSYTKSDVYRRE